MEISNITKVVFGGRDTVRLEKPLTQYDYGQYFDFVDLDLPDTYTVLFSNSSAIGTAKPQTGNALGVRIPDEYLATGRTIYAWLFLHAGTDDGKTVKVIVQPVAPRPAEDDAPPTPVQLSQVEQLIAELQAGVQRSRVTPLLESGLATGAIIDAVGIPVYIADVTAEAYAAYGLQQTGWYVFGRIAALAGTTVTDQTTVTGADGAIVTPGAAYVDVAVRFEVAAMSKAVTVSWGALTETYVFRADDLAIRNLDYRSTFYVYDIAPYATWSYKLSPDATFNANKKYFTRSGDTYTEQTVTAGENVPAVYYELDGSTYTITEDETFDGEKTYYTPATPGGTDYAEATVTAGDTVPPVYYVHDKVTFAGMTRNVTYRFDEVVDGGVEFVLPEIESDDHGAWIEVQLRHSIAASATMTPPDNTIKFATAGGSASITAGINVIDLHYTNVANQPMWTLINVHTNIPA